MTASTNDQPFTTLLNLWQCTNSAEVVQDLCRGTQLTDADQELLLRLLDEDPILQRFPPRPDYTQKLLKAVIAHCEHHGVDAAEEVLCRYAAGMCTTQPAGPWTHRTYLHQRAAAPACGALPAHLVQQHLAAAAASTQATQDGPTAIAAVSCGRGLVTLRVSDNMLAGGTGCHPWEAGFLLAELVLSRPIWFKARRCLELGCGSGLVGVALHRAGAAADGGGILLTDGDREAVKNCCHNLTLNGVAATGAAHAEGLTAEVWKQQIVVTHLDWTELAPQLAPDVILGADLLYDPETVPALVAVLRALLLQASPCEPSARLDTGRSDGVASGGVAYLASKRRNERTLQLFLDCAESAGLALEDISEVAREAEVRFAQNACLQDRGSVLLHRVALQAPGAAAACERAQETVLPSRASTANM